MEGLLAVVSKLEALDAFRERKAIYGIDRWMTEATNPECGTPVFVIATRGLHRNPTRDRTEIRLMGRTSGLRRRVSRPLEISGRECNWRLPVQEWTVFDRGAGVPLAPFARKLHIVKDLRSWGMAIRRAFVPLDGHDARLLGDQVARTGNVSDRSGH